MSTAVQLRRGTTAQHSTFTGAVGEITVDTTKDTAVVHDGSTVGGFPLVKEASVGITVTQQTSNTGSVVVPVGTTAERNDSPVVGYLRYNTDTSSFEGYKASGWGTISAGATGGGSDEVFFQNGQTVNFDHTIPVGKSALSAGPVTIASGKTVTVSSGSRYVIV